MYFNITDQDSPQKIMGKIKRIKSPTELLNKSKYTVRGGVIGGAVGFLIAAGTGKNKYVYSIVGVISGVVLGDLYSKLLLKLNNNAVKKSNIQSKSV